MSFSPPPGGPPYPPQQPPWPPQQQWSPGPPPKKRGNGWKWALGAVALMAVIGVTVAVTISVTKDDTGNGPNPSGNTFGLASADDKGPANIITEDPTCAAWTPINDTFAQVSKEGWNDRDPAIPAVDWTPELRADYEEIGRTLRVAAEQTIALVKITPHRVMRELYQQFIAYARAYSDTLATYKPKDDHLARVANSSSTALAAICAAIDWKSAQARAPLVPSPAPPTKTGSITDPTDPQRFLITRDSTCTEWLRMVDRFDVNTQAWQELDPNIAASNWTPKQRAIIDSVIPVMLEYADEVEQLGRRSANPVIQDFAALSAQYRRAYVAGLPTYTSSDFYLADAAARVSSTVYAACNAAGV